MAGLIEEIKNQVEQGDYQWQQKVIKILVSLGIIKEEEIFNIINVLIQNGY